MAMRKFLLVASVSLLSGFIAGCESLPFGGGDEPTPSAEESPAPTATASPTPTAEASPTPESFEQPVVAPGSNLLQSTNPEERVRQVQAQIAAQGQGATAQQPLATVPVSAQADPFAILPITPIEASTEAGTLTTGTQTVERSVPSLPGLPVGRPPQLQVATVAPGAITPGTAPRTAPTTAPRTAPGTTPGTTTGAATPQPRRTTPPIPTIPVAANPVSVPDLPEVPVDTRPPAWVNPNPPAAPFVPPPPDTSAATGIEVTGVVRTGKDVKIIVKAPGEPTSRYVNIGQRIANGEVLVKRVDNLASGLEPIVIFEQNGIEVAKELGAEASPPEESQTNLAIPIEITQNLKN